MKKAMLITVGTGRDRQDIAGAIVRSIRVQNPAMLVFFTTRLSSTETMPYILQDPVVAGKERYERVLPNEDEFEDIVEACMEEIDRLIEEGFNPDEMVVDFTSGTKTMSSAITFAGLQKRIGLLVYVTGKRGKDGRVISGTERPTTLFPGKIFSQVLFENSMKLFNIYQYKACREELSFAKNLYKGEDFLEKAETFELLAYGYELWDGFHLKDAFEKLRQLKKNNLLVKWGVMEQLKLNLNVLHKEKESKFCYERMVDLLEHARRRGEEEGRYDIAVAILYRLMEYVGQYFIFEKGLYVKDGDKVDTSSINLDNLTRDLQGKYMKYLDESDKKVKLGLFLLYELLKDLNSPVGEYFFKHEKKVKSLLSLRNLSIYAHGFNPLSYDAYKNMYDWIRNMLKEIVPNFENLEISVRFPKAIV